MVIRGVLLGSACWILGQKPQGSRFVVLWNLSFVTSGRSICHSPGSFFVPMHFYGARGWGRSEFGSCLVRNLVSYIGHENGGLYVGIIMPRTEKEKLPMPIERHRELLFSFVSDSSIREKISEVGGRGLKGAFQQPP